MSFAESETKSTFLKALAFLLARCGVGHHIRDLVLNMLEAPKKLEHDFGGTPPCDTLRKYVKTLLAATPLIFLLPAPHRMNDFRRTRLEAEGCDKEEPQSKQRLCGMGSVEA